MTMSKKSEAIRPPAHATFSDCFVVRARKLAVATIGENVNNQLVQESNISNSDSRDALFRQFSVTKNDFQK